MKLTVQQAKEQFIQEWGNLVQNWGQPRSVGVVHGYLLTMDKPVPYDQMRKDLQMSAGGSNSAILILIDIGIVRRSYVQGDRAEHFVAEKDMWQVAKAIARYRQRKELDPLTVALQPLRNITGPKAEVSEFTQLLDNIGQMTEIASKSLTILDRSGIVSFLKILS